MATPVSSINSPATAVAEASRHVSESDVAGLERLKARHEALLEALDEGYCVIDVIFDENDRVRDYRFLEVNAAFSRLTGIEDAVGRTMKEIAPEHEGHWFDRYGEVARTGKPARFQNHAASLNGRWYDVLAFRVDAPDSHHVAVLFSDISESLLSAAERRKAEEALAASEARFRRLIELSPVGIALSDSHGGILLANDAFLHMLGYTREEASQVNWIERTPPEYLPLIGEQLDRLRRGEPPRPYEKEYVRRDGTRVAALVVAQFLPGDTERMMAFALDVTERKNANQALRESAAQLRRLIDNMAGFVAMLDRHGTLLEVNEPALRVCGEDRANVIGRKFWELTWWGRDAERKQRVWRWVAEAIQGKTIRRDLTARTADGGQIEIDLMLVPVFGPDGQVTHIIPSGIDVSARKRIEMALRENEERLNQSAEALQDADRRKDDFLATLAHELRNPLAPIRNGVQILRMMSAGNSTLERTTQMMERQMRHLVRLVDDLLDVSRITRGKVDLRREPVLMNEVISGALESCQMLFKPNGHALQVHIPKEPLTVTGDPDRLRQVFSNLLSNAAKFTPGKGTIWVDLEKVGAQARVRVRDTGVGIPADRLHCVFEMFAQEHSEHGNDGLGIGLALVRQLVALHGGVVTAESEGPGRGSEFTVCLPLSENGARVAMNGAQASQDEDAATQASSARHVLVVDDNVDAADSLQRILELQGHEVRTCTSGEQAVEMVRDEPPDVIFMDIGMPGMDGLTTTRNVRSLPGGKSIRIIALTGWGQESDRQRTHEAGFDEHVVKPVSPESLSDLMRELGRSPGRFHA